MKKLLFAAMAFFSLGVMAQNIQLHYDFGDDRNYFTSTVEDFRPDDYGSLFYFIDMDYSKDGVQQAYWEIARELKFWDGPISAHVEYNGGLLVGDDNSFGAKFNNAYLLGATYSYNNEDFTKGISFSAMYKYIQNHYDDKDHNFQLTTVWYMHFFDRKLSFTGFADFWKEETSVGDYIFITEPQIWYNFTESWSVGSEIEMSNNFANNDGFMVNPTIAIRWTLK